MLTLYALGTFFALLVVSFLLAGISHNVKALTPIWLFVQVLCKLSALAVPVCIVVDIVS